MNTMTYRVPIEDDQAFMYATLPDVYRQKMEWLDDKGDVVMTSEPVDIQYERVIPSAISELTHIIPAALGVDVDASYPTECSTCGKPYVQPSKETINFCSNGFHGCRDCSWLDGRVVTPCEYHRLGTISFKEV